MKKEQLPMGVSEWMNHGKKYKYWDYFVRQITDEIIGDVDWEGKSWDEHRDQCIKIRDKHL